MKDARGHGSNGRGIVSVRHKVKDPTWTGTVITHGGGQPKPSNAEAAGALASTKSAAAPVHDGMKRYAPDHRDSNAFEHSYNPDSVNQAIANSGRFGGGKIGGREARMIHSLLKGRG